MRRLAAVLIAIASSAPALAQGPGDPPLQGPPAPLPPAVITRDLEGRATIRATRVDGFDFDGRLDEPAYQQVPAFDDFVQQEPREGQPATEKTEVWVLYDKDNLSVAARLWESESGKRVATEMRRDASNLYNNDHFGVSFDTFTTGATATDLP